MSELIKTQKRCADVHWRLLTGASLLALLASLHGRESLAADEEAVHNTVWIELGGQLERVESRQDPFAPPFTLLDPEPGPYSPVSPLQAQRAPSNSYGAEGQLKFQPAESNWTLSVGVRYGRSNNNKHIHQQSVTEIPNTGNIFTSKPYITYQNFSDVKVKNKESHLLLDFAVGRDLGLGIFGRGASSILSFGVRVAEFDARSQVSIIARPDARFVPVNIGRFHFDKAVHNDYVASATDYRSFHGIGPSLSWDASVPLVGGTDRGEVTVDWGVNAAVLFGRQKAKGAHQVDARYYNGKYQSYPPYGAYPLYFHATPHDRSRTVTVPNVGGFLGASFRYPNATVSFGYRADFFFGAMDGGIDTRKTYDRNFYGPFATISIGLGG